MYILELALANDADFFEAASESRQSIPPLKELHLFRSCARLFSFSSYCVAVDDSSMPRNNSRNFGCSPAIPYHSSYTEKMSYLLVTLSLALVQ